MTNSCFSIQCERGVLKCNASVVDMYHGLIAEFIADDDNGQNPSRPCVLMDQDISIEGNNSVGLSIWSDHNQEDADFETEFDADAAIVVIGEPTTPARWDYDSYLLAVVNGGSIFAYPSKDERRPGFMFVYKADDRFEERASSGVVFEYNMEIHRPLAYVWGESGKQYDPDVRRIAFF